MKELSQLVKKIPLVCTKCEFLYEYKGEVCLEDGKLEIKVALCTTTRAYLERVIIDSFVKDCNNIFERAFLLDRVWMRW